VVVPDEWDSPGKVDSLRGGLTKLRKYGGRRGFADDGATMLQLGHHEAQVLLSCSSTKLILAAAIPKRRATSSTNSGTCRFGPSRLSVVRVLSDNSEQVSFHLNIGADHGVFGVPLLQTPSSVVYCGNYAFEARSKRKETPW
jgi:hypothetical protein